MRPTMLHRGKQVQAEKALAQFRKDFMPGGEKVGYHFNLNELVKACEVYNNNYDQWNEYQAAVFWSQVVGYLERLVSACDAQVLCQGIKNVLEGQPLERSFDLDLHLNGGEKKISFFPLDVDPFCYLGGAFAVMLAPRGRRRGGRRASVSLLLKNMSIKNRRA